MINNLENAIQFVYEKDKEKGEGWSDDSNEIAKALVEYANFKINEFIKDSTVNVKEASERIEKINNKFKGLLAEKI